MTDPTPTDPIERTAIDRDDLGLSLAEHWHRQGIVRTYPDLSPDEFEDDDTIVFRAYLSAVDFILGRLSAAGLLAATPATDLDIATLAAACQAFVQACADHTVGESVLGSLAQRVAVAAAPASAPAPADDEAAQDPTWHEVRGALLAQVRPSSSETEQFIARDPLAALADTLTPESIDSVRTAVMRSTHHGEGRPGESGELTMLRALIAAVRGECGHESARRVAWDRDEHARNLAATQAGFQRSLDDIRAGIVTLESVRDLVDHRRKTLRMDDLVAALSPKDKP